MRNEVSGFRVYALNLEDEELWFRLWRLSAYLECDRDRTWSVTGTTTMPLRCSSDGSADRNSRTSTITRVRRLAAEPPLRVEVGIGASSCTIKMSPDLPSWVSGITIVPLFSMSAWKSSVSRRTSLKKRCSSTLWQYRSE